MQENPYQPPISPVYHGDAAPKEREYVTRVQRRWEIFHLFFAVAIGYSLFVFGYAYVASVAADIDDYLSSNPVWLTFGFQLIVSLVLEIPIGLGAAYLASKIRRKWKQFGLVYSVMLIVLIGMLFNSEASHPLILMLMILVIPAVLLAMRITRRVSGIESK